MSIWTKPAKTDFITTNMYNGQFKGWSFFFHLCNCYIQKTSHIVQY